MDVLAQDSVGVRSREHIGEDLPRLVRLADGGQRIGVPELADEERGLGRAEVILGRIAHDEAVAAELLADDLAGLAEALVARRQQPEVGKQKHAGIEIVVVERAGDRTPLVAPGSLQDLGAQLVGVGPPIGGALAEAQQSGHAGQAVAGHPAHGRGVRMDA